MASEPVPPGSNSPEPEPEPYVSESDSTASNPESDLAPCPQLVIDPSDPLVQIFVGAEKQEFSVQKALLQARSKYFHTCLSGDWEEARNLQVDLVEEDPAMFDKIVEWMREDTVQIPESFEDEVALIETYALADRLLVPEDDPGRHLEEI